jgi:hypothetical protein
MDERFMKIVHRSSLFAAALTLLGATFAARALDPPHLEQLPPVEKVLADNQGADPLDAKARQVAALNQWGRAVGFLAGEREFCCQTPDEQRLAGEYRIAASAIEQEMLSTLSTAEPANPFKRSERMQWLGRKGVYEKDAEFRSTNFGRYLSPDLLAVIAAQYKDWDARFYGEGGREPSRLDAMDPGTRRAVMLFYNGVLVLLLLIFVRELLPFGSRRRNALKVGAGFRLYYLQWATGRVTDFKTWKETVHTKVSEVDQYGNHRNVRFYAHTYVHESFTLVGARGRHEVHVVDAAVQIPDGQLATAVWATRRFRKQGGDYVLFFDRTSGITKPVEYGIGKTLAVRMWIMLPLLAGAFVIGGMGLPVIFPSVFHNMNDLLVGLLAVFVMWIVALVWIGRVVIPRRTHRFVKRDAPRVLAAIEKEEPAEAAPVTAASSPL